MQIAFAALLQNRFDYSAATAGTGSSEGFPIAYAFNPDIVRTAIFDEDGTIISSPRRVIGCCREKRR